MSGLSDAFDWNLSSRDRREHPRKFLSGAAHLLSPGRAPIEVRMLDISIGGIGLVSPMNMPHEWSGHVRFTLTRGSPGVDTLLVPVQVVHSVLSGRQGGFVLGMRFVDLPEDTLAVITRYIDASKSPMGAAGP